MTNGVDFVSYNPYAYLQQGTDTQGTASAGTSPVSFAGQLNCDTCDFSTQAKQSGGVGLLGGLGIFGVAALAGTVAVDAIVSKGKMTWTKAAWNWLKGNASKVTGGGSTQGQKTANSLIPNVNKLQQEATRAARNKAFEPIQTVLAGEGLTLTEKEFAAIKKAETSQEVLKALKKALKDNGKGDKIAIIDKYFGNGKNSLGVTGEKWLTATAEHNAIRNPNREFAVKLDKAYAVKEARNKDFINIKNGGLQKLLEANPDEAKQIYKLANKGKVQEVLAKINDLASKKGSKILGSVPESGKYFAQSDIQQWVAASRKAEKFSPEVLKVKMAEFLKTQNEAYTNIMTTAPQGWQGAFEHALSGKLGPEHTSIEKAIEYANRQTKSFSKNALKACPTAEQLRPVISDENYLTSVINFIK